ncbi:MAG: acyltransferase [Muribaculaceae bacterium]|nr:acyltransferase [Muribaculaceae bacterium]
MTSKTQRQSNMELLRIVSMLMVLAVHIDGASLGLPSVSSFSRITTSGAWRLWVEAFTIVGVNCFTLLSGYYGIRLKFKSISGFLFQCLFYSLLIYSVALLHTGFLPHVTFSWNGLLNQILVLSRNDLWYVPAYFTLCLLAPFLNAGCNDMKRSRLTVCVSILVLFNLWSGWYWGGKFNPTGYTIMQLVMVYLIGRVICLYIPIQATTGKKITVYASVIYLISVALIGVTALYMPFTKAYAYNSPAVLSASIALFLFFRGIRLHSATVNALATSAFAVYLVHKNPLVWQVFKGYVIKGWQILDLWQFSVAVIIGMSGFYLLCFCIDRVRILLWKLIS